MQLICTFAFVNAKSRFSHGAAHIIKLKVDNAFIETYTFDSFIVSLTAVITELIKGLPSFRRRFIHNLSGQKGVNKQLRTHVL